MPLLIARWRQARPRRQRVAPRFRLTASDVVKLLPAGQVQQTALQAADWDDMREHSRLVMEENKDLVNKLRLAAAHDAQQARLLEERNTQITRLKDAERLSKHDKKTALSELGTLRSEVTLPLPCPPLTAPNVASGVG